MSFTEIQPRPRYLVITPHHQVSFTEIQPLLDKIRNTNIWMSDGPKMQFALATLTLPLPLPLPLTLPLTLILIPTLTPTLALTLSR